VFASLISGTTAYAEQSAPFPQDGKQVSMAPLICLELSILS